MKDITGPSKYSLYGSHSYIYNSNIINGKGDQSSLIVQGLGITYIIADTYSPGQEDDFTNGQTMIPPIVRTLFKS